MKPLVKRTLIVGGAVAVAIQLVPIHRTNPPVTSEIQVSADVHAVLKRACYDCHSNETRWPWYAAIPPASWLVVRDVTIGRKEMNFSNWTLYSTAVRTRKARWMNRSLQQENMPPWEYRLVHPDARVTEAERIELERWLRLQMGNAP